jgi:hypothetical protein
MVCFISYWSLPRQALINYNHIGYVSDYAVRGEFSNGHARSNADRHQKVCLWDVAIM